MDWPPQRCEYRQWKFSSNKGGYHYCTHEQRVVNGCEKDTCPRYGGNKLRKLPKDSAAKEDIIELEHFIIEETNAALNIVKSHNATHQGKKWITNGEVEYSITKDQALPNGFRYGRKPNDKLGRSINK